MMLMLLARETGMILMASGFFADAVEETLAGAVDVCRNSCSRTARWELSIGTLPAPTTSQTVSGSRGDFVQNRDRNLTLGCIASVGPVEAADGTAFFPSFGGGGGGGAFLTPGCGGGGGGAAGRFALGGVGGGGGGGGMCFLAAGAHGMALSRPLPGRSALNVDDEKEEVTVEPSL